MPLSPEKTIFKPSAHIYEPHEDQPKTTLPEQLASEQYSYDQYWTLVGELEPDLADIARDNQRFIDKTKKAILTGKATRSGANMANEAEQLYRKLGTFNHMRGSEALLLKMYDLAEKAPDQSLFAATLLHELALLTEDEDKQEQLFQRAEKGYLEILHTSKPGAEQGARAFKQIFDIRFYRYHRTARQLEEAGLDPDHPEQTKLKENYIKTAIEQVARTLVIGKNIGNGDYLEWADLIANRKVVFDRDEIATTYVRAAFEREDEPTDTIASSHHQKHSFDVVVSRAPGAEKADYPKYRQLKAHDNSDYEYIPGITDIKVPSRDARELAVRVASSAGRQYVGEALSRAEIAAWESDLKQLKIR